MGLKKKIGAAVVGLGLGALVATSASAFQLPKFFKDYQSKAKLTRKAVAMVGNHPFLVMQYDIDGDKKADVSELYPVLGVKGKNEYVVPQNPLFYTFDLNRDGKFEQSEIYLDKKMDGINGNEINYLEDRYGI